MLLWRDHTHGRGWRRGGKKRLRGHYISDLGKKKSPNQKAFNLYLLRIINFSFVYWSSTISQLFFSLPSSPPPFWISHCCQKKKNTQQLWQFLDPAKMSSLRLFLWQPSSFRLIRQPFPPPPPLLTRWCFMQVVWESQVILFESFSLSAAFISMKSLDGLILAVFSSPIISVRQIWRLSTAEGSVIAASLRTRLVPP